MNKRLVKEYQRLAIDPPPFIYAKPRDSNILEWHYVITGPPQSLYEGGEFHGMLIFPPDYPFKPPGIKMMTPNGRFQINYRICLSISDYHPLTWNPAWSVSSILTGLLSFMLETTATLGSIETTDGQKKQFALDSHTHNLANPVFRELFPDIVNPPAPRLAIVEPVPESITPVAVAKVHQKSAPTEATPVAVKSIVKRARSQANPVQNKQSEVIEISSGSEDEDLMASARKKQDTSDDDLQILSFTKR